MKKPFRYVMFLLLFVVVVHFGNKLVGEIKEFLANSKYEKMVVMLREKNIETIFCVEEYGNCYNELGMCVDNFGNNIECAEITNKDLGVTSKIILLFSNGEYNISAYASSPGSGINSDFLYMLCMTFESGEYEYMFWYRESLSGMKYYDITSRSLVTECIYKMEEDEYYYCTSEEVVKIRDAIESGDKVIEELGLTHEELVFYFSIWYENCVKPIKFEAIRE